MFWLESQYSAVARYTCNIIIEITPKINFCKKALKVRFFEKLIPGNIYHSKLSKY